MRTKLVSKSNISIRKRFLWLPTVIGRHCYWLTNYVELWVPDKYGRMICGCRYIEDNGCFVEEGLR